MGDAVLGRSGGLACGERTARDFYPRDMAGPDAEETERRFMLIRKELLTLFYKSAAHNQRRASVRSGTAEQNLIDRNELTALPNPGGSFSQAYFRFTHPERPDTRWAHVFAGLEDPDLRPGEETKAPRSFRPIPRSEHLAPPPSDVLRDHPHLADRFPALQRLRETAQTSPDVAPGRTALAPQPPPGTQAGSVAGRAALQLTAPAVPVLPGAPEVRDAIWDEAHSAHTDTQNAVVTAALAAGCAGLPEDIEVLTRHDVGWETQSGAIWLCEAKSLISNESGKIRLGLGQLLDYMTTMRRALGPGGARVHGLLALSAQPSDAEHWMDVCEGVSVALAWCNADGTINLPPRAFY